eukprot:527846_1
MDKNNLQSTKSSDINVKIFESKPSGNCGRKRHLNCAALQRMFVGLKYYDVLFSNTTNIKMTETETKQIFLHFNEMVYNKKQLLDDHVHIIKQHNASKQIIEIQNELKRNYNMTKCNISKCSILSRHYRARGIDYKYNERKNTAEQDSQYEFYCECYHKIHHQIFHLFQMGLRCIPDSNQEIKVNDHNDDDIDDDLSLVDKEFEKKRDL